MENLRRTLFLTNDTIESAVIVDDEGKTVYTTETNTKRWHNRTELKNASGEVIAMLEWHDSSDKISFGRAGKKIKLGKFLQEIELPGNEKMGRFSDDSDRNYTWKGINDDTHQPLTVYEDRNNGLVALLTPAIPEPEARPAALYLSSRGCEIEDRIVMTFLIIQRARRDHKGSWILNKDVAGRGIAGNILAIILQNQCLP
ncbi:hypothetical protein SCHPADRAFT_935089 [Schizopora paradoxa]|uniref:DUF6593 domain-containing protein n=1 Tax=Schizopora paradoxa TaxID=27342 RepID=A0A0H2SR90_9AGAM|nr:hypothetical protein SCHPADRAFT_935089 [Schizopora paradoxa]